MRRRRFNHWKASERPWCSFALRDRWSGSRRIAGRASDIGRLPLEWGPLCDLKFPRFPLLDFKIPGALLMMMLA
jgi:hypothetical protein